jgi:hypothetical protein
MQSKKASFFLISVCTILSFSLCFLVVAKAPNLQSVAQVSNEKITNPVANFEGYEDDDVSNVMVPIPMKDRVYNKTGIQCVWASLECIGRYAEEKKLINLTNDSECQGYSSPSGSARKLMALHVKFEQTTSLSDKSLIRKAVVKEKRGVLFGIPGHAMVMVHYDEAKGIIKYINNSDKELKIRTWTIDEFNRRWDGWICAVYADVDHIPNKWLASTIKVIDMENLNFLAPKNYILFPK